MLIRNYSYVSQICGHNHSGVTSPVKFIQPHTMRGYYGRAQVDDNIEQIKRDSFPTGTNPPYSIVMGDKGALLSSTTTINGVASQASGLSMGINILAGLTGSGTITDAQLSLITALAASLNGSGTITTASLVGIVSLAASLSGTGSLTAGLNVIAYMNSVLAGTSSVTAGLRGTLSLEANIYVNQSEADVQQIVDGVWNALTADYNASGTMGEAMGNAGAGGDPWSTALPGAYAVGTAGYIIGNNVVPTVNQIAIAVWDELQAGHITEDTYGKIVSDLEILAKQIKSLTAAQL